MSDAATIDVEAVRERVARKLLRPCPRCGREKTAIVGPGRKRYRCRECDREVARGRYTMMRESGTASAPGEYKGPPRYRRGGKEGQITTSHGYTMIYVGKGHPEANRNGYAYEHRLVAATHLGRNLEPGEIVHHRDGNKQNNDPANLEVLQGIAEHALRHRGRADLRLPGEPNLVVRCGCGCGGEFPRFDDSGRPRQFLKGHASLLKPAPTREAILRVFDDDPARTISAREIIRAIGCSSSTAKGIVCRSREAGVIVGAGRGVYALADAWRAEIRTRIAEGSARR